MAVLANSQFGGCTYDNLSDVVEEQKEAERDMPGPLPVISSELILARCR